MEALLLGIYAFFVWLIFIKFNWPPFAHGALVIAILAITAVLLSRRRRDRSA